DHALGAVDAALEWLHALRGAAAARVDALLSAPEWKRTVDALQTVVAELTPRAPAPRVSTRVRQRQGRVELALFVEETRSDGSLAPPRLLAPDELQTAAVTRALPQAPLLAPLLRAADPALAPHALRLLAGSLVTDAEEPARSVRVVEAELEVAVREDAGQVRFAVRIAGQPGTEALLANRALEPGPLALYDREGGRCLLVVVSPALAAISARLLDGNVAFPFEAAPPLLEKLEALVPAVRLHLPASLQGARVEPDDRLVLQLAPTLPTGVRGQLRTRPLAEGPALLPGRGQPRVSAMRHGRRVYADRDFAGERRRADALLAALGLRASDEFAFNVEG
ncbi:MAG: hypothetical protein ACK4N5_27610, partial [Myxococcales bacterium]